MSRIRIEREGPARTITLTRSEKRNALDMAMLDALFEAFSEVPDQADRVIVLRAEGPAFCAGMDLAERLARPINQNESPIEKVLEAIEHHPLPVVCVVQGDAIAGGNELALHCDFVVAASTARFGMSLAQIGLTPTWFLAKKLMEVAGPVATREILLLGDPLPSEKMLELGIISRVAPPEDLDATAALIINRLAANAPLSLKAMKALLVREMAFRDNIAHADIDELVQAARSSKDAKEGIAARLEKRAPNFVGE